jgi:cytochrome b
MSKVRIWDLPTRVFHWTFATACIVAWITGDSARYTDIHIYTGYLAFAMLLFRLVWGFTGGRYARFTQFITGPGKLIEHLRHIGDHHYDHGRGHNPAGAIAVVLMLGLVLALSITGLIVLGGEEGFGPLAGQFTLEQGDAVHVWHEWLAWIWLGVVVVHLSGVVLMGILQRESLVIAMFTGNKDGGLAEEEPNNSSRIAQVMFALIVVYSVAWFFPYLLATEDEPYLPFVDASLIQNQEWHDNCDSCHIPYHPSLLPAHSWQRLFDEEMHHFGEGLFLDIETMVILRDYAVKNSADHTNREVSWRILNSLDPEDHPNRITETPYWEDVHRDIDEERWDTYPVYGKADCGACHMDAYTGGFMNGGMFIPE